MNDTLTAVYYGTNQIAVLGGTKKWKENLKELGCTYRPRLPEHGNNPGWLCPKANEGVIMQFISNANAGAIQPKAYTPRDPQPAAPMVGQAATPAAMAPGDALALLRQNAPQPAQTLPPAPQTLTFPNLFIGADGVPYQVMVYTAPLPQVGKRVSVTVGDTTTNYLLTSVAETAPFDSAVMKAEEGEEERHLVFTAGSWLMMGQEGEHTVTFHS